MFDTLNRRSFLQKVTRAGSGLIILSNSRSLRGTPANEKLNIAGIGVGGRGAADIKEDNLPRWGSAVLFVGSDGMLIADYNKHQLLPEDRYRDFQRPDPFIPNSIGHHREWVEACKTGGTTTCHFDYSGALTEAALLCNVALRTGKPLIWDAQALQATNCPEADAFIRRPYRKGWVL